MTAETPVEAAELPRRTGIPVLRKWTSFGTGLGIEVGRENLQVVLTRVRPGGIHVLDAIEILRYRERPAAEWSVEFQAFLNKHKIGHLPATVVLPPADAISRFLPMPGVNGEQLDAAVRYQLEGLHPFAEEDAIHSHSRLAAPNQGSVSIAVARQTVIGEYATIFDEAGIEVASFSTCASAIYSALRVLQLTPADQFLAVHENESGSMLLYGETASHPIYFVHFDNESSRALSFAASQIRLPEHAPIARLASLLPHAELAQPVSPIAFAASLASALPRQALGINLLPVDRRKTISPLRWVPTLILLLLLMVLGISLAYLQEFENRKLLTRLDGEIAKLQPTVARVRAVDSQIEAARKKTLLLRGISDIPRQDLDSLRELTHLMPNNAYVSRLDMNRTAVSLSGEIDQAAELLKQVDASPLFKDSEFTASPARTQTNKEIFSMRANRELPAAPVVAGAKPQ